MKRVKLMLTSVLVLAVVAGAVAFKVKSPDVCAYATTSNTTLTSLNAPIAHASTTVVISKTIAGQATQYAATYPAPLEDCPTVSIAFKSRTLSVE